MRADSSASWDRQWEIVADILDAELPLWQGRYSSEVKFIAAELPAEDRRTADARTARAYDPVMRPWWLGMTGLLLLAAGCDARGSYLVELELDPASLAASVDRIELAVAPSCPSDPGADPIGAVAGPVRLERGAAGRRLDLELPPGRIALHARAWQGCDLVAAGCDEHDVVAGGSATLAVRLVGRTAAADCPWSEECCGAACVSLADDERHCGACCAACAAGERCAAGACASGIDGGATPDGGACAPRGIEELVCDDALDDDCNGLIDCEDLACCARVRCPPGSACGDTDVTPPTTPTDLIATLSGASVVRLSWVASTDDVGVTGYDVESCTGSGCSDFGVLASVASPGYEHVGAARATEHTYRVRARDAASLRSDPSNEARVTTPGVPGIVAAYAFEDAGATVADGSGGGRTLTRYGATPVAGTTGNGLSFDGDDYLQADADYPALRLAQMTLMAWVAPAGAGTFRTILRRGQNSALNYRFEIDGAGTVSFAFDYGPGGYSAVYSSVALADGVWAHVAATYDGVTARVYVDSVERGAGSAPSPLTSGWQELYVGRDFDQNQFFRGSIDEVRIFDRALGAGEIATEAASP